MSYRRKNIKNVQLHYKGPFKYVLCKQFLLHFLLHTSSIISNPLTPTLLPRPENTALGRAFPSCVARGRKLQPLQPLPMILCGSNHLETLIPNVLILGATLQGLFSKTGDTTNGFFSVVNMQICVSWGLN